MAALVSIVFALMGCLAFYEGVSAYLHADTIVQQIYGIASLILSGILFNGMILSSVGSSVERLRVAFGKRFGETDGSSSNRDSEIIEILSEIRDRLSLVPAQRTAAPDSTKDEPTSAQPIDGESIRIKCTGCGKVVRAKSDWAGKQGKCPSCGQPLRFPSSGMI